MGKFRQFAIGLVAAAAVIATSAPAYAQACGATTTTTLYAGQTIPSGTVSIYNDAAYLYVTYTTDTPWVMSVAHVAVASTLAGIPQTKTGNPIPGRFPYHATFDPEVMTYTFVVPMAGTYTAGQSLVVAAHAVVHAPKSYGGSQTGWGYGPEFPGSNWATYIEYRVQKCGFDE